MILFIGLLFIVWSLDGIAKSLRRIADSLEKIESGTLNSNKSSQTSTPTKPQVDSNLSEQQVNVEQQESVEYMENDSNT